MRASFWKGLITLSLISGLAIAIFILAPGANSQSYDKGEIVKLYSGDNLVGTWKAVTRGQMDGNTYVFKVGTTTSATEVRICGTFSVERVP